MKITRNEKWKTEKKMTEYSVIFNFFDSKLLKNDPVHHKYYYFMMVDWGKRLKS